jgi:hypothetical protein
LKKEDGRPADGLRTELAPGKVLKKDLGDPKMKKRRASLMEIMQPRLKAVVKTVESRRDPAFLSFSL